MEMTQSYLKTLLHYDPDTGVFTWLLYMTGRYPENCTDHINGQRSDNRWENLREVTVAQNMKNMARAMNNTSGHQGISWCKRDKKWFAYIKTDGVMTNLGRHATIEAAIEARKTAEKERRFHQNHGR